MIELNKIHQDQQNLNQQGYGCFFDIKKFALNDGPGIRTTVFFKGCPLKCSWCHNPESKSFEPMEYSITDSITEEIKVIKVGKVESIKEVFATILQDTVFYQQSKGGVTFSGGEPLAQIHSLNSLLKLCKNKNLHTAIDTCGYSDQSNFEKILDKTDLFLFDLKIANEKEHIFHTGVSNIRILENLQFLVENNANIEINIPLIPNITDSYENLNALSKIIKPYSRKINLTLLPYNILGKDKARRFSIDYILPEARPQTNSELVKMANVFQKNGINTKISGLS